MSCRPTIFDALGLVRTMELLAADRYYGVINTGREWSITAFRKPRPNRWEVDARSGAL